MKKKCGLAEQKYACYFSSGEETNRSVKKLTNMNTVVLYLN